MNDFIMESLCLFAKKGDFLPEFSICIFISSSVAEWYKKRERVLIKKERDKEAKQREGERDHNPEFTEIETRERNPIKGTR